MPGILFPSTDKGDRSTTAFGKDVLVAAASALPGGEVLCQAIKAERDWRHKYNVHWLNLFEAQVKAPLPKALDSLRAGLAKAREMDFETGDGASGPAGTITPLGTVMAAADPAMYTAQGFDIASKKGLGQPVEFEVPFEYSNCVLKGPSLEAQLDKWANYGCMEPDCAQAIKAGASTTGSMKDRTFVIIGAGSELCPVPQLLRAGATVAAIATRKPARWAKLLEFASGTAGTLLLPVPRGTATDNDSAVAQAAGVDLMGDTPAIADWVRRVVASAPGLVTIGTYLYTDGGSNVCLTVASDYIIEAMANEVGKGKVSFAWLGSPSTAYIMPDEMASIQKQAVDNTGWWMKMLLKAQPPAFVPTDGGQALVMNGYIVLQGPNYALAQHLRHWRAMLLHSDGFLVSAPMAPSCRTESVTHNGTMKALMDGMYYIRPLEAFHPETAQALLFALLVSDLTEDPPKLASPLRLFTRKSFHGGFWRCPWSGESLGRAAVVLGKVAGQTTPNKC